jgi:hypothetical protein
MLARRRLVALFCAHLLLAMGALCLCPGGRAAVQALPVPSAVACHAHAGAAEGAGAPASPSDAPSRMPCPHCDGQIAGALAAADLPAPTRDSSFLAIAAPGSGIRTLSQGAFASRPTLRHHAAHSPPSISLRNCALLI